MAIEQGPNDNTLIKRTSDLFEQFYHQINQSMMIRRTASGDIKDIEKKINNLFSEYLEKLHAVVGETDRTYVLGYYAAAIFKKEPRMYAKMLKALRIENSQIIMKDLNGFMQGWNIYSMTSDGARYDVDSIN